MIANPARSKVCYGFWSDLAARGQQPLAVAAAALGETLIAVEYLESGLAKLLFD